MKKSLEYGSERNDERINATNSKLIFFFAFYFLANLSLLQLVFVCVRFLSTY
jgi:hypothetical protein